MSEAEYSSRSDRHCLRSKREGFICRIANSASRLAKIALGDRDLSRARQPLLYLLQRFFCLVALHDEQNTVAFFAALKRKRVADLAIAAIALHINETAADAITSMSIERHNFLAA